MIEPTWLFYWLLIMWSGVLLAQIIRVMYPYYMVKQYISGKAKMHPNRERFCGLILVCLYLVLLGWLLGYIQF